MQTHKGYSVIYADPPWAYRNRRTGGSLRSGAAQRYPCLTVAQLSALPVEAIAAPNAVLFLWVTTPMLPEGLQVLSAWGFRYKTMLIWRKLMSLGMGYWFRGQTEQLLVGLRGHVQPFRSQKPNTHQSTAEAHSHKPAYFRSLIEEVTASLDGPKAELFATERVPGWDACGLELGVAIEDWLRERASALDGGEQWSMT